MSTQKHLTLRLFLLLCINILLLPISVVSLLHSSKSNVDPKFLTPVEVELLRRSKAAEIKSWLDTSVNPCNDFYEFVCGNWQRVNAPDAATENSAPRRSMEKRVQEYLNVPKLRVLGSPENKVQTFYESCRNIVKDTCLYEASLRRMTDEFGQFSFLKKRSDKRPHLVLNWWLAVAKIYSFYGKSFIVEAIVDYDLKDKTNAAIYLRQPAEVMKSKNTINRLKNHYSATEEQARQVAENVEQLEKALEEITFDFSISGHKPTEEYTLYNRSDVQELFRDLFNLDSFLMVSFNTTNLPKQLYIQNNKYFEQLAVLFKDINMDTVEDYIILGLVQEYPVIHENDHIDAFCSSMTRKYFIKFMENAVYQQFRSAEFEKAVYDLWYEIKTVFLEELKSSDRYNWMFYETREQAIRKLKSLTFHINSYEDEKFEDFFRDLHIDAINYVVNTQNIKRHVIQSRGNRLHVTAIDKFNERNLQVPVYYSRLNEFRMPVSNIQPFHTWHSAYPNAIKYAQLGFTLSHEMLHAFDDYNRHFDANGNAQNWWDEVASNEYEAKRRCFQAQYHNYTINDQPLADIPTQSENIADNAAVRIAYLAYNRWIEWAKGWGAEIHNHESFANLPYNLQELFFISYGQQWCRESKSGGNVPAHYRVNGPLSNFPTFSQVFKCFPKAPMNPAKKCEIF